MFTFKLVLHSLSPPDSSDIVAGKTQANMHPETVAIKRNLVGLASEIHKTTDAMSNLKIQTGDLFGVYRQKNETKLTLN